MSKGKSYYCWRDCIYGEHRRKGYKVGDKLIPGEKPGKYFSEDGEPPDHIVNKMPILSHGDDPRSTLQLRKDLKKLYNIELPDTASRKVIFQTLKLEEAKAVDAAKPVEEEKKMEKPKEEELPEHLQKKVVDMSPDEVDALTSEDLAKKIKHDHGVTLRPTKKNKDELLDKLLQFETSE